MSDEYAKGYAAFRTGVPYNAHQSQQWHYGWLDAEDDEISLYDDDYYDDYYDDDYYYQGGYGDGGF